MSQSINAAVVREKGGEFLIEKVELSTLSSDEVLVKIAGCGICHTDLVCRDQHVPVALPHIFGHEGSGVVAAVGNQVTGIQVGDHVVLSFSACGHCSNCHHARPAYCSNFAVNNYAGIRSDGSHTHHDQNHTPINGNFFGQSSFASYAITHQNNTIKVRNDIAIEQLAPLGCGVQTGAGAVLNSLKVKSDTSIVIFGAGTVGLSAVMAARLAGCRHIIVVDTMQEKQHIAQSLGATDFINANQANAVQRIHQITGNGADYSLDCVGNAQVLRHCVDCLHSTGTAGLVGLPAAGTEVALDMHALLFGKTVTGIMLGDSVPQTFIPQLINHFVDGNFPFDQLIRFYDFNDINSAVDDLQQGNVIKPVLTF